MSKALGGWAILIAACVVSEALTRTGDVFHVVGRVVGVVLLVVALGFIPVAVLLIRGKRAQVPSAWLGASWAALALVSVSRWVLFMNR